MTGDGRQRPAVLVVDDEAALVALYEAYLADAYAVRTATTGEEALHTMRADIDVVIIDRRMPTTSGDEVVATISDRGFDCRIAMLSAIEPAAEILDLPIDEYLTKPVTRDRLLQVVEELHARGAFDDTKQQLCRLTSKRTALRAANRDGMEEYRILEERIRDLADDEDTSVDEIEAETVRRGNVSPHS